MELSIESFNKLILFIDKAKNNNNYELEVRFWNNKINEDVYKKIFQKLTFSKDNNGLGLSFEMKNILDVLLEKNENNSGNIRMSIFGENDVKKYWLNDNETIIKTYIEKEKIDKIDDYDYNLRFSLNNELPQEQLLEKNKNRLISNSYNKTYRFKNRYSIITEDQLFSIDMSSIKMGVGKTFKESNTLKSNMNFEIEIEFIGKNSDLESSIIIKKLLYYIEIILKILNNTTILISNRVITEIKNNYYKLIKDESHTNDNFIAASPVTIHRENLLKSDIIKNVYNKYAVTLKADGERHFLIVHTDGKIYIFNNHFNFIDTGYSDIEWMNTLIEAEYISNINENELYMYDILFSKGVDVRKLHLMDVQKESRLGLLDQFLQSSTRKLNIIFNDENSIKIKNKKYLQSLRNDGSDIFQKVKELWDNKKYASFHVDGIIFTPKYEYYPNHGGSWYSLFKWKPENLNTIDFLIKIMKDDYEKEIKNPYIQVIERPDGKQETILKQYKIAKLYVTGEQKSLNKKKIPILFNPYNTDEKNSENYNLVKIFIEENEKIYAFDPITNEKNEIYDDIIVEFGYDHNAEYGFQWKPYRFRKDKTMLYKSGKPIFGNSEKVALDIFKAIHLPVTESMITTGSIPITENTSTMEQNPYYLRTISNNGTRQRYPYQNFHNHYIKYQLLYFSSPSYITEKSTGFHGKILDLCCGKGVDINKIKRARYAEIVGMDMDYQNIKDAKDWYKSMITPPPKAYYVRGDSSKLIFPEQACSITESDKIYTKKFIPTKYMFDTLSLQFCFHYFFKDEISFRTLLQNINDNLKIGGFVIGTTFDGERVYEQLKNNDFIIGKTFSGETLWKIDKKYGNGKFSFTEKRGNFGKEIDVFVKTIGVSHLEYLVNFKYVDKIMEEYGFSKVVLKPFQEFYQELIDKKNLMDLTNKELEKDYAIVKEMSLEEQRFSFLSSGFIYKKERNSSDNLMKKLVEMMEKKHKLKKEGNTVAYKLDDNTEHILSEIK